MLTFEVAYEELKDGEGLKVWQINTASYQNFYLKLFGNDPTYLNNCERIVEFMTIEEQYAVGLLNDSDIVEAYKNMEDLDRSSIRDNE
jgi:hypothetical protein